MKINKEQWFFVTLGVLAMVGLVLLDYLGVK
jgi:hypothetical protein